MDNQHKHIKGYRDLTQAEIDLMNEIKAKGEELKTLCEKVSQHVEKQIANAPTEEEGQRLQDANPGLWADWGKGNMQSGIMYLVRAVAQPTTF